MALKQPNSALGQYDTRVGLAPLNSQTVTSKRGLKPTSSSGVQSPASAAAFSSLNIGADQARGLGAKAPGAPAAPAAPAAAAASTPAAAPAAPASELTPGQTQNYSDWFANNDQTGQQIQNLAQQQAAAGNRKAAYLASMSGGNGGFYQSGQIAAGIAGQNMMQQGMLQNAQARGDIYNDKGAALQSIGLQNDTQDFTREQAGGGASQSAAAGNFTTLDSQIKDGHPGWGPNSDAMRDWDDLGMAYKTALGNFQAQHPTGNPLTDPSVMAALAALKGFDPSKYDKDKGGKTAATLGSSQYGNQAIGNLNTLGVRR